MKYIVKHFIGFYFFDSKIVTFFSDYDSHPFFIDLTIQSAAKRHNSFNFIAHYQLTPEF